MEKADCFVSVVCRLRNHAKIVDAFINDICEVLEANYTNYELVLIDDRSEDDTVERVVAMLEQYRCIRLVQLSQTMGLETAIAAGLETAIGDFVVVMSPDHDPAGEIVKAVETSRKGSDVVVGVTDKKGQYGLVFRMLRAIFYVLYDYIFKVKRIRNTTDFRVFSRKAVNALTSIRQKQRFLDILISTIGFKTTTHEYKQASRSGGSPAMKLSIAIRRGIYMIIFNSSFPLRFVNALGILGSLAALSYAVYVIVINIVKDNVREGWTTISFVFSILFFLLFFILALLGEYIGRLLQETADRPLYYILDEKSSKTMIANEAVRNVLGRSVKESEETGEEDAD